jgi:hypothetical protein
MLNEMIPMQGLEDAPVRDHWRSLAPAMASAPSDRHNGGRVVVNAPVGSRISPQQLIASRSQQK